MPSSERPSEDGILIFLLDPRKNRAPISGTDPRQRARVGRNVTALCYNGVMLLGVYFFFMIYRANGLTL